MNVSPKAVQQHGQKRAEEIARLCARKYAQLIGPLRATAKAFGYALAVHGSLKRDLDFLLVPWVEQPGRVLDVVEALRSTAHDVTGFACLNPNKAEGAKKPHGRLAWEILLGGNAYIDLSMMPPRSSTDEG